jgi:hypothetical protein
MRLENPMKIPEGNLIQQGKGSFRIYMMLCHEDQT